MTWNSSYVAIDGDVPTDTTFDTYFKTNIEYLKGSDATVEYDVPIVVPAIEILAQPFQVKSKHTGTGSTFRFIGVNTDVSSSVTNSQSIQVIGTVGERDGNTSEALGYLQAGRTAAGTGNFTFQNYQAGAIPASSASRLTSANRWGIKRTAPAYTVDVNGSVRAKGYKVAGVDIGAWTASLTSLARFLSASGLNDLTTGLTYSGTSFRTYLIKVETPGTPDKIGWSSDGGVSYTHNVSIGVSNTLDHDVTVAFGATTGHTGPLGTTSFTGSGTNDLTKNSTYNGSGNKQFRIEIDAGGTPGTFQWSHDNGETWGATGVVITGSPQTIEDGVIIQIPNGTAHTLGDHWDFAATEYAAAWKFYASPRYFVRYAGSATVTGTLISSATAEPPFEIQSTTKATNLNVSRLGTAGQHGYTWPSQQLEGSRTTGILLTPDEQTLCSVTTVNAGWHVILGFAAIQVSSSDADPGFVLLSLTMPGSSGTFVSTGSANDMIPVPSVGLFQATAGQVLKATVSSTGWDSTSTATGHMTAIWIAPPS